MILRAPSSPRTLSRALRRRAAAGRPDGPEGALFASAPIGAEDGRPRGEAIPCTAISTCSSANCQESLRSGSLLVAAGDAQGLQPVEGEGEKLMNNATSTLTVKCGGTHLKTPSPADLRDAGT